jgi:hypothetical protein
MHPNFSNLRLRYRRELQGQGVLPLVLDIRLSSLNFDINHATIGRNTPFTTEMSFQLSFENNDNSAVTDIEQFSDLLNDHFSGTAIANTLNRSPEARISQITNFIQGDTDGNDNPLGLFADVLDNNGDPQPGFNISLLFFDIDDWPNDTDILESSSLQLLAGSPGGNISDLMSLSWPVKVKFHSTTTGVTNTDNLVLFPQLFLGSEFDDGTPAFQSAFSAVENTLELFNSELRLGVEMTYLPEGDTSQPMASPLGRVADEISDSITTLTNTIATNLSKTITTQLQPPGVQFTEDLGLWVLIKRGTDQLSFVNYLNYMDQVFCGTEGTANGEIRTRARLINTNRSLPFMNVDAYSAVKVATEAFVMVSCMANRGFTSEDIEELNRSVRLVNGAPNEAELNRYYNNYLERVNGATGIIPYLAVIRRKLSNDSIKNTTFEEAFNFYLGNTESGRRADTCYGLISDKLNRPCFLELIWSYWHEESMMVQGLNAISRRFQNIRGNGKVDPLANLEIDPLRPLNNLLWGYVQDHQHRLTVRRRAYEYNHHYGMSLRGEAARDMRFADPRSKFIESFHTLLNLASRYYKQADDMTVKPDGFPILNGLRETHLVLSEGAHNQYGDLPSTSRAEMLMEQWLLARPEFREFLPTRVMTAYPEPWMDRVAALNQMMGWTKTSVLHFNYLAVFGEKILLSIRFGNWADTGITADAASNWANFWRQEIQGYIHAYRAVTGVDLSADGVAAGQRVDTLQPSVHLYRRLQEQQNGRKVA